MPTVRRLLPLAVLGAALLPSPATAGAVDLREVVLAGGTDVAPLTPGITSVSAGYGVAAWVEVRERGGVVRYRIGAETASGRVLHRPWTKQPRRVTVVRRVDRRTGRAVVRVVDHCGQATSAFCSGQRLLDPKTLLVTTTEFRTELGAPFVIGADIEAGDGATHAATTMVDEAPLEQAAPEARPTSCVFTLEGSTVPVPNLADCARPSIRLRYGLLLAAGAAPSQDSGDGTSGVARLSVFDLGRPEAGWVTVGQTSSNKGGSNGVLQSCLLSSAVATLSGFSDSYGLSEDPAPWTLEVRAARLGGPSWSAQIPAAKARRITLLCSARSVYALYAPAAAEGQRRLVRLAPAR